MVKVMDGCFLKYFIRTNVTCLLFLLCALLLGCQYPLNKEQSVPDFENDTCQLSNSKIILSDRIGTLRYIADAFNQGCYGMVLSYGTQAKRDYRYKQFSVFREATNIFLPDGMLTDYVLESYERAYLAFLLAAAYYHLGDFEAAMVELRWLDHEIIAPLYNHGEDPINILFAAVMWQTLGQRDEARIDWSRLSIHRKSDTEIKKFALKHIQRIDDKMEIKKAWKIYGIGEFPAINWDLQFTASDNGYFSVTPEKAFDPTCVSETGIKISLQPWFSKIALRHNNGYHPLLNAQSWIRLPFGVFYSVTTFAAGAGIAVTGCVVDFLSKTNFGSLCEVSINGGGALIYASPTVLRKTLQPDLRHWDNLPESFLFTDSNNLQEESCFLNLPETSKSKAVRIL